MQEADRMYKADLQIVNHDVTLAWWIARIGP
jgi:hypothetical protein